MPPNQVQTAESRRRIVESAARLFKTQGYEGVGIQAIMAGAGLTRGTFYAHFVSKQELLREVVGQIVLAEGLRKHQTEGSREPTDWPLIVLDHYLSPAHRDDPGGGCPMAALSADVSRAEPSVRAAYTDVVRDLLAELERGIPADRQGRRGTALATLAECVGAMVIARAVDDASLSGELLEAARREVRALRRTSRSRA